MSSLVKINTMMSDQRHSTGEYTSTSSGSAGNPGPSGPSEPRIAVLPFSNASQHADQDYFGEGLAAELIIGLTRIPGLHLLARSSVFALKRDKLNLQDIEKDLGATAVLTGTVQLADEAIAVTVELLAVPSGRRKWIANFERRLDDVFVILDEIVAGVTDVLGVVSAQGGVRKIQTIHTSNIEAYDRYLRGRQHYYRYGRKDVETALDLFRQAIDIDPAYALAYCGISDCYAYLYTYHESSELNRSEADAAAVKALELDPMLAEAHASRGVSLTLSNLHEASAAAFERAVELDPRLFEAHYFYARACFVQGDLEKAIEHFAAAHRARPEDYQAPLLSGQIFDTLREPEKAAGVRREGVAVAERHLKFHPHDTRALYMGANGLVNLGEREKGLEWLECALSLEPDDAMLLYNAGCIYALVNRSEEALICLERTVAAGLTQREWYEHDSNLDSVRNHPRFEALLASMD